ncbi:MAG: hypothetical protein ACXVB9_14935 [Bdellovibrionota bacterium]
MKNVILALTVLSAFACAPAIAEEDSAQLNQEAAFSQPGNEATPDQDQVLFHQQETISSCIKQCGHSKACNYSCTMGVENQN